MTPGPEEEQDLDEDEERREGREQRETDEPRDDEDREATRAADAKALTDRGRIEILKGQKFITKEPNYETSLFSKWENINKKYHLLGWRHLRSWKAYVEMFSELQTFLYELAGNVPRENRERELAYLEEELAAIRMRPQRLRIPLMYNLAAHLFHNVDLGLKKPSEKSLFDLDVDKVFAQHEDRIGFARDSERKRKELIGP